MDMNQINLSKMTDQELIQVLKSGSVSAPAAFEAERRIVGTSVLVRDLAERLEEAYTEVEEAWRAVTNIENALFKAAFALAKDKKDLSAANAYMAAMGPHCSAKDAVVWVRNVQLGSVIQPPVHKYPPEDDEEEAS